MRSGFTESEYRMHADETIEKHGFRPTFPDSEGRKLNSEGTDTPKLWVGEIYHALKYETFEVPSPEDPSRTIIFGSENQSGDQINPRFPFGQFSITRIPNGANHDQIMMSLQIYMNDKNKINAIKKAFGDEFFSVRDIATERIAPFFSRFDQSVDVINDQELPNELRSIVEKEDLTLYNSIKIGRVLNIGERTDRDTLSSDSLFAIVNVA